MRLQGSHKAPTKPGDGPRTTDYEESEVVSFRPAGQGYGGLVVGAVVERVALGLVEPAGFGTIVLGVRAKVTQNADKEQ